MSTSIAEPDVDVGHRRLTAADVAALPDLLPSGQVKYELEDGRLIVMAPPGDAHGAAQLKIGALLLHLGEFQGHGKARTETSIITSRDPDTVLVPNALFVASRSLPIRTSAEGYLETIPEIVVEVRGKNDSRLSIRRKGKRYLAAGFQMVWILDPHAKTVTVLRQGTPQAELPEAALLIAGEFIPGFSVCVGDLFTA